jgi:hypothetical protein
MMSLVNDTSSAICGGVNQCDALSFRLLLHRIFVVEASILCS